MKEYEYPDICVLIYVEYIAAGAIPKETISARESSSLPMSLLTFRALAAKPSQKSKRAPAKMRRVAVCKCPLMA